jgi:hypothetical protein
LEIEGVPIWNPSKIQGLKRPFKFYIAMSEHRDSVAGQLTGYGLVEGVDFFDFYGMKEKFMAAMINREEITDDNASLAIVKMEYGLGNQMFHYLIGRCINISSGLRVKYDLSWFNEYGKDEDGLYSRKFELTSVFSGLQFMEAPENLAFFYRLFYPRTASSLTERIAMFTKGKSIRCDYDETIYTSLERRYVMAYSPCLEYMKGHWDTIKRVTDEFKFTLELSGNNMELLSRINSTLCPVAVHIRQGDFIGSPLYVATPEYFKAAVGEIAAMVAPAKPLFFVFSNGMDWARKILSHLEETFVFVEDNDNDSGAIDMFLMSRCRHFIISNSSFSFWAAMLSKRSHDKIVIMPDKDFVGQQSGSENERAEFLGWKTLPV